MSRIQVLPDELINQIAAGEVVERPASVVKELIENAHDADSRFIQVDIVEGGTQLIRVTDDGTGMSPDELELAVVRHATSKISTESDLMYLRTLGFRGEALPSIASVSRMTLSSRTISQEQGFRICLEGGKIVSREEIGCPVGTEVLVEDLFFNTPARKKFLKTISTEKQRVHAVMTQMALTAPAQRIVFRHNDRDVFRLPETDDFHERLTALFGSDVTDHLIEHSFQEPMGDENFSGRVWLSRPHFHRGRSNSIHSFINGRSIRDRMLFQCIMNAYRTYIPDGRYPQIFLFLELPPGFVDVNVHPRKEEVRFADPSLIRNLLRSELYRALAEGGSLLERGGTQAHHYSHQVAATPTSHAHVYEQSAAYGMPREAAQGLHGQFRQQEALFPRQTFSSLRIIGQAGVCYIVCEDQDRLLLIDQHAAHERVAFDRLQRSLKDKEVAQQGLIPPLQMDLSAELMNIVETHHEALHRLGFDVDPFGAGTVILRGIPSLLRRTDPLRLFRDVLDDLSGWNETNLLESEKEHVLATMACHSVIRQQDRLSMDEMEALLKQLDELPVATSCPHGRPIMIAFPYSELERRFLRS